jgi:arabinogalactan oligomer/maltooligosaccharide transport system substrate-binding protein
MVQMFSKLRVIFALIVLSSITACAGQATPTQQSSSPSPVSGEQGSTPSPDNASPDTGGAIVLTIWLPPDFDVAGGNLASNLLQDKLAEFTEQHPQVRTEIRVKAEEGTGGMLDSLLAAQSAAPLAQPDLILLPHIQLQDAVHSGVLSPLSTSTAEVDRRDWYPFAQQMASIDGQTYGLPFAADALAVAFRPTAVSSIPSNWNAYLDSRRPLGLAVADPWAQFSLAELAALHENADEATEFSFTEQDLRDLFEFYSSGQARGVFPFWFTQYQTYEQSWQAFTEGRVPMVVAWTSRIFDTRNVEILGSPLPTQSGRDFTLVKGWVLVISTPNADRIQLVTELAEFLTTPEFIAQWSAAAGLLPSRASSLAAWAPDTRQALASQIVLGAVALPSKATLELWGQPLADATVGILKQELTPQEAVEAVQAAITNPE